MAGSDCADDQTRRARSWPFRAPDIAARSRPGMTTDPDLLDIAESALPGVDRTKILVTVGEFHDVLVVPGQAVIKVARGSAVLHLARRARLLDRLSQFDLPFDVPVPLSDVVTVGSRAAVALTWVGGEVSAPRRVTPDRLRAVLGALAEVPLDDVAELLDEPHAYAGRGAWPGLMLDEVVPRLPIDLQAEAARRIHAALDLPPVNPRLVHGDLGGDNLRWTSDGAVAGVIDWDLAQPFDPAIDAACLASWYGWDNLSHAVDAETHRRARTWFATFGLEQVASALDNGEPDRVIAQRVRWTAQWIRETDA